MSTSRARTRSLAARPALAVVGAAALAVVTACGAPQGAGAPGETDGTAPDPAPDTSAVEYHVFAGVEERDGGAPVLCIGPMPGIYPAPPCTGPTVEGLDWDEVPDVSEQDGVRSARVSLVGTWSECTLTLTRPPAAEPPADASPVDDGWGTQDLGPLCADPWRGGDETLDPLELIDAQNAMTTVAADLPGYVTSYVSNGYDEYNVVVSAAEGDAEAAHAALREVWPGWLCVAEQDLPTASDIAAAQSVLYEGDPLPGLMSSGSGADGVLRVDVEVADPATLEAIHDAVAPWLTPDQVRVTGVLQPLT
ncbi:hypothetical protein [Litorihabitans aurantiacus]|uniref:Uncharacterized protein n=1 Tax=Litorihabitans aurantiacus TaxID=1930061 RepID=A0AA37XFM0_9MICO|nr:hypothetical protein [Litorihabitans aurantiacus]GMA32385.1 hypothetical protein GCM10025875_23770 [Litorihabitans aurantiacus]